MNPIQEPGSQDPDELRRTSRGGGILHNLALCLLLGAMVLQAPAVHAAATRLGVPGVHGGVVATSEPPAAQVGADILRAGGNAVDAAAAVMFALNVVEPQSAGIGGGGFMMIHLAGSDETLIVDSRETAPTAATADMLADHDYGTLSTSGIAVGVPGAVRGVELALERWGSMDFATVLQPAIRLAEDGFHVSRRLERSLRSARLQNASGHPGYDEARRVFHPNGEPLQAGERLVQPDLARTLRLLAEQGPGAFYRGPLAEAIIETQRHHRHDDARLSGRMTLADLAEYQPAIRSPVQGDYRGIRVVSMPPPSSGGLTVLGVLGMLEHFPIGDGEAGFGVGDPRTLHVMVEAMRLAFADRAVWMGDEDVVDVPVQGLLDPHYISQRAALIDADTRRDSVAADDPRPFDSDEAPPAERVAAGNLPDVEAVNTTHFSIVDRHGNVVSYTNTIESPWGTGLMVPDYGFLLNNELTDFNHTPTRSDAPDAYDPGANDVAPGKRPRSSMAPTMLFVDEQPLAAFGSPGGATIINTVINVAMALIDHDLNAQEAADLPRISQTAAEGTVLWEAGVPEASLDHLRALGHSLASDPTEIGAAQLVVIDPVTGRQYGAADRRRIGGVVSLELDDMAGESAR